MKNKCKFGITLTRILANPDIKPLAKIVLRNELERYIKSSKRGKPKGYVLQKKNNPRLRA
jgi:hypothetical protein